MIRNFKTLGLALIVVFALSAVVASAASAQQGTLTSDGPVTLIGDETGAAQNRLTAFGAFVECPGSIYTGHKNAVTPHGLISSGETTATLTPHYNQANENCVATLGWKATVHMNGCDYVIHLGETTGGVAGTYGVTFDVICPAGKEITVTLFTNNADLTSGTQACVLHVKEQKGLAGAHATDTGNGHIDLTGTVEGIHVTKSKPNNHTILCQNETTPANNLGKFDLDVTVTGKNAGGGTTGISLSHP